MQGIDVSSHQGSVGWESVASDGYRFAFVKATGGTSYVNPYHTEQVTGAREAGLAVGHYHYAFESSLDPYPGQGPEAEAEHFLEQVSAVGIETGDMLVLDVEEGPDWLDVGDWCLRFLGRVESEVGFPPLVYTGAWFSEPRGFGRHPELAAYPLWLAAYGTACPPAPEPWSEVAFWQYTADGTVSGVDGPCDVNQFLDPDGGGLGSYGQPSGVVPLPRYDWQYPAIAQEESFDCSETAALWALRSWGLEVDEQWLEDTMIAEGVMTAEYGLMQASGAGLAEFLNRHWGDQGFEASNADPVTFDQLAEEAGNMTYPLMIGGRRWGVAGHWSGCRNYDASLDRLELANPAPGYDGIDQTMTRSQFNARGQFSTVRLRNPEAEGAMESDYGPWEEGGKVGSGLIEMMKADGVLPAQDYSTWLPLGRIPAQIEECIAQNGTVYRWLLTVSQGYRYRPS